MGRPKGSARIVGPKKAIVKMHTPKKSREALKVVKEAWEASGCEPFPAETALSLSCRFYFARPQTHYRASGELKDWAPRKWHVSKVNDLDNLMKLVKDGLNDVAFPNDGAIVTYAPSPEKLWVAGIDDEPRTEVLIFPVRG